MVRQGISVKVLVVLVVFVQGLLVAHPQDALPPVKVGDPAPAVALEVLLQAQINAENIEEALKGKVVVLEFWATWCGPCREAIPHLNELEKEFRSEAVRFLSVTDEEEWKVKNFLKVNPIAGWIGIDADSSLLKAYGFRTIPQTVVIDRNGRIAALTSPQFLNTAWIRTLLEGGSLPQDKVIRESVVAERVDQEERKEIPAEQALFELSIRPAPPSNSMSYSSRSFKAKGLTLKKLVSLAYDVSQARLLAATTLAEKTYAVSASLPKGDRKALKSLLRQAFEVTFGLNTYRETRDMEVFVLKTAGKTTTLLRPSKHDSEMPIISDDGQISTESASIQTFCVVLEDTTGKAVLNETGLSGLYEIALYWEPDDPYSVIAAIKEQLGLELRSEVRPIEVTVFETKE